MTWTISGKCIPRTFKVRNDPLFNIKGGMLGYFSAVEKISQQEFKKVFILPEKYKEAAKHCDSNPNQKRHYHNVGLVPG